MINSLKIKNFQSHADTKLDFNPGVNVIVGASDSGKSAIIRALKWVIWNRPRGSAFRSNWGGATSVSIHTSDNDVITRGRTDADNIYKINNTTLEAVKNDVPEEIAAALNMDETNLQQQLDQPFLISNSPGEVALYFNKIAHLDQIDIGNKKTQSSIRALSGTIQSNESHLQNRQNELEGYEFLDQFEIDLEALEKDAVLQEQAYGRKTQISAILEQLEVVEEQIAPIESIISLEAEVDKLLVLREKWEASEDAFGDLCDRLIELDDIEKDLLEFQRKQKMLPNVISIIEQTEIQETKQENIDSLLTLITSLEKVESDLSGTNREICDMEAHFDENMPEKCPLCGTDKSKF